jgi:hypothetical protein
MRSRPLLRLASGVAALALIASACGSSGSGTSTASPAAPDSDPVADGESGASLATGPVENAAEVAAANINSLVAHEDIRLLEVLDVDTGEPTTIAEVVDGDRPVLLWFWAPH